MSKVALRNENHRENHKSDRGKNVQLNIKIKGQQMKQVENMTEKSGL